MPERAKPENEVRLGVVLYGGVSLAIYMYGVVYELWRLVRASEGEENEYSETLRLADATATVDIVSGASAGGINGILLAKALATGADLEQARALWLEDGDLDGLLHQVSTREPNSLLDSEFFRGRIKTGLDLMDKNSSRVGPLVEVLDLFVATSRLRGKQRDFVDWLGKSIYTREYPRTFNLRLRTKYELATGPAEEDLGYDRNDFTTESNDRLTKLARTTSAFPGAFEPTKIGPADDLLTPPRDEPEGWFSDGGILHNRPFTETISTIFTRTADRPVRRWLLSVDPDPERGDTQAAAGPQPDFVEVVRKASGELPRYQSIAADLDRLDDHNQRVTRFKTMMLEVEAELAPPPGKPSTPPIAGALETQAAAEPHRLLRRRAAATDLAARLIDAAGLRKDDGPHGTDPAGAVESAVSCYLATKDQRLDRLDLAFRLRRLYYAIELLRTARGAAPDRTAAQTYDDLRAKLWRRFEQVNAAAWETFHAAGRNLSQASPNDLYAVTVELLEGFAPELSERLGEIDDETRTDCGDAVLQLPKSLAKNAPITTRVGLGAVYGELSLRDLLLLPLDLLGLGERERVEHIRVAPSAATHIGKLPDEKLAGDTLMHFGGFLNREWRENDMLWGRLDTAEVLTRLVLQDLPERPTEAGEDRAPAIRARARQIEDRIEAVQREIVEKDLGSKAIDHEPDWKAYLRDEYRHGSKDVLDLPWRRLGRLTHRALGVFRNMLRGLDRGRSEGARGKAQGTIARWVGAVLEAVLQIVRWPAFALLNDRRPARRIGVGLLTLAFVWGLANVVLAILGVFSFEGIGWSLWAMAPFVLLALGAPAARAIWATVVCLVLRPWRWVRRKFAVSRNRRTTARVYAALRRGEVPSALGKADESARALAELVAASRVERLDVLSITAAGDRVAAEVAIEARVSGEGRYREDGLHLWRFAGDGTVLEIRRFAGRTPTGRATRAAA